MEFGVLATRSERRKYIVHTAAQMIEMDTIAAKIAPARLSLASSAERAPASRTSEIDPAPTHSDAMFHAGADGNFKTSSTSGTASTRKIPAKKSRVIVKEPPGQSRGVE